MPETSTEFGLIPAAEVSYLAWKHQPKTPGPCRVCGAPLVMVDSGGADAAKYACGSPEADTTAAIRLDNADGNSKIRGPHYKAASKHYQDSQVKVGYGGDPDVGRLVAELRHLREAAGEDMTIPVGEKFYPLGHGHNRCWWFFTHLGEDQWTEDHDSDYTHDPSHGVGDDPFA